MDDQRYSVLLSDNRSKGLFMVVRETIRDRDGRVIRDTDFTPEYFDGNVAATKRQEELNKELL